MYDTILVPTDGSDSAIRAAANAGRLARRFDATVHLLAIVDIQAAAGPFSAGGIDDDFRESQREDARERLEATAAVVDESPETTIVEGTPQSTIVEYAAENDVDLVAMGTHGRSGVRRYVAGSVCEHVVRHATQPVLTVRERESAGSAVDYEDVLVPTDGSDAATAAIDHGVAVAAAFDARLHAVNVVDLGDVAASSEYTIPGELLDSLERRGENALETVVERAEAAGVETMTEVVAGQPARDLLAYVEDAEIDLVTMGTAGRTGLGRFLMGSTTERIIRHAPVPVLSVNESAGTGDA